MPGNKELDPEAQQAYRTQGCPTARHWPLSATQHRWDTGERAGAGDQAPDLVSRQLVTTDHLLSAGLSFIFPAAKAHHIFILKSPIPPGSDKKVMPWSSLE